MANYGLITIHDTLNYGSLLQAFSLYKAVETLEADVEILDYQCKAIADRETTYTLREIRKPMDIIRFFTHRPMLKKRRENMRNFLKKNAKISKTYYPDTIREANRDYRGFIVGSDIVWGMKVTGNDFTYMLDFAQPEKKKIAFSSSVGEKWPEEVWENVRKNLLRFDAISVREQLAQEWIQELTGRNVEVTCDPTMLWARDFWENYVNKEKKNTEKYVLVYMTTADKKNITDAIDYGRRHDLTVYYLNFNRPVSGVRNVRPMTVEEWVTLFANAEIVFSASYHGMLYAMYFERPLFYYNRGNKARMQSLGEELQILHREGTDRNVEMDIPMDYIYINQVLEKKRRESWTLLKERI